VPRADAVAGDRGSGAISVNGRNQPTSNRRLNGVKRKTLPLAVSTTSRVPCAQAPEMTASR